MLERAKYSPAPATPNLADAENRASNAKRKRLESGGRNASFLMQAQTAATADRAPATLTGLSGGGGGGG